MEEFSAVEKRSEGDLRKALAKLPGNRPIALTLSYGERTLIAGIIRTYLKALRERDPNMFVILVDGDGKFVASIESSAFSKLVGVGSGNSPIIEAINQGNEEALRQWRNFVFRTLTKETNNIDALQVMKILEVNAMVVADNEKKPIALIKRNSIIEHVMDGLVR